MHLDISDPFGMHVIAGHHLNFRAVRDDPRDQHRALVGTWWLVTEDEKVRGLVQELETEAHAYRPVGPDGWEEYGSIQPDLYNGARYLVTKDEPGTA